MGTSKSPRRVLIAAYRLGWRLLPQYSSDLARHDFTLPQLFACLVLRQFYGLSYRRAEKLLADSPEWLAEIGLAAAPDHNTLWRAFHSVLKTGRVNRMIDVVTARFAEAKRLGLGQKPLAMDSTCFERHHRSVHYDHRCRQMTARAKDQNRPEKPGSWGASVNASRRRSARTMPKLSVAVACSCHLILAAKARPRGQGASSRPRRVLAAKARIGNGSDAPDFDELLHRSWKRAPVKVVVADSGYDSEANHCIARQNMNVRSIIPPGIGRPTSKLPRGRWRRHMAQRFARKADKKLYGQRSQSETVHSMIKRNQGSALRSRTPDRRKKEMLLRTLTHNIALLCALEEEGE